MCMAGRHAELLPSDAARTIYTVYEMADLYAIKEVTKLYPLKGNLFTQMDL